VAFKPPRWAVFSALSVLSGQYLLSYGPLVTSAVAGQLLHCSMNPGSALDNTVASTEATPI